MEEEEEGEVVVTEVADAAGLRRTRRAGLMLLLSRVVGSMRAEKEEEACNVVEVDWGMRVPARRTATPGGGIRKAWVCVSPMVVRARRTASTWRRDVVRLCILMVLVMALVLYVLSRSLIRLTDFLRWRS